jgi:hypothetical protein
MNASLPLGLTIRPETMAGRVAMPRWVGLSADSSSLLKEREKEE